MAVIVGIIIGILSGITVFFPVSSTGIMMLFSRIFGFSMDHRLFCFIFLGMFAAGVVNCFPEIVKLVYSLRDILKDLFYNFSTYAKNLRDPGVHDYRRILTGNYRRFLVMILEALIPATVIGILIGRITEFAFGNLLAIAMGFLVTGMVLIVSSYMNIPERGPKQLRMSDGFIMGAFQGFAFLPGISKTAMTASGGFLSGMSRKMITKFAAIITLYMLGLTMASHRIAPDFDNAARSSFAVCIPAMLASGISAYYIYPKIRRKISRKNGNQFAGMNLILGVITIVVYSVTR